MATKPAQWRSATRQQFRLDYGRDYMRLLKWQAKRGKPKKDYLFLVLTNDTQYFVIVET